MTFGIIGKIFNGILGVENPIGKPQRPDFSQGFIQGYQAGQAQAREQCENEHDHGYGGRGGDGWGRDHGYGGKGGFGRGDDCGPTRGPRGGGFNPFGNVGGNKGSFMEMLALVLGQILDREQGKLMDEAKNLPGANGSSSSGSSGSSDQSKISLFNAHAKQYESLSNSLQQAMSATADGNKTLSRGQ